MGLLSLTAFRTRLQRILGNRGLTNGDLDAYINLGYSMLAGQAEFENQKVCAIFNTVAGTYRYLPPTRMIGIISLILNTEPERRRLRKIDLRNFGPMERDTPAGVQYRGAPRVWSRRRDAILLWPTPDAVYELEVFYYEDFASLSADGDVTKVSGTWDWAVLCNASYIAFSELGEDERAEAWLARGGAYLRSRMEDGDWEVGTENVGVDIARESASISGFIPLP